MLCLAAAYGISGCSGLLSGSGNSSTNSSASSSPAISVAPSSVSFGNVAVGTTNTQTMMVTNSGNADLSISQATITGAGLSLNGLTIPLTVAAGKSSYFNVAFSPSTTGSVSGTLSLTSNAPGSPTSMTVAGSGVQSHTVSLSWSASTSTVAGYYVYRGIQSGGPYMRVNFSPVTTTSFSDLNVPGGQTVYYVTTAVDTSGIESLFSNQVAAVLP